MHTWACLLKAMLFHAFRVVYTGKELDSHAKHGQSLKKKLAV